MIRTTIALFAFWLLLTGGTTPAQLISGLAIASALAFWVSRAWKSSEARKPVTLGSALALVLLVPLLLVDVVRGAFQVAGAVLRPRLAIEPVIVERRVSLRRELSRVMLVNSITLAPGTMAVDAEGDVIRVHCLSEAFGSAVAEGRVEDRVARALER